MIYIGRDQRRAVERIVREDIRDFVCVKGYLPHWIRLTLEDEENEINLSITFLLVGYGADVWFESLGPLELEGVPGQCCRIWP